MAKKKDLNISPEMLQGLSYQSEEESKKIRQMKELREKEDEEVESTFEKLMREEGKGRAVTARPTVKKFDRKRERPIQKTVHLSIEIDNKVNMVKSVLKTLGKKTTFEDLLFDLLDEWLKENYDDILAGKMIYPGEK